MKKTFIRVLGICIVVAATISIYISSLKADSTISQSTNQEPNKTADTTLFKSSKNLDAPHDENAQYLTEISKRVNLYIAVMKSAFNEENGGNSFIAVRMETLEGLKDEKSKKAVLEGLKSLSKNVYWYEDVRKDKSLFEFDNNGAILGTLNGTILSIKVEEYKFNEAVIEATSWFGNLGAVFPKYKAIYKNGQWQLEVIGMAIS